MSIAIYDFHVRIVSLVNPHTHDKGVPHCVLSDDIYEGYLIPAGSVVLGNCWCDSNFFLSFSSAHAYPDDPLRAILHDETMFPDPDAFKPERFLDASGGATSDYPDAAFGFGRRVCPGRFMAHAAVWLAIVSVLSTFDISKAVDEDGNEIVPAGEFIDGLIMWVLCPVFTSASSRSRHLRTLDTKLSLDQVSGSVQV